MRLRSRCLRASTRTVDRRRIGSYAEDVCRNIRVLHHFDPPTTPEEIRAAAVQYVRKVTGTRAPSKDDAAAFERAVDAVAEATTQVLSTLRAKGPPRTRERERERARERWASRKSRMLADG